MKAFTLVEVLSVLALLALIIGGGVGVWGQARHGELRRQTRTQMAALASQLDALKLKSGEYPDDLSEFPATDSWNNPLVYQADSHHFILRSAGNDHTLSTPDDLLYDSLEQ